MSEKESAAAVVFDVEFTAWDTSMKCGWLLPGQFKEIIQIGAVKVDRKFHVLESFCVFVRPRVNPHLSDYIEDITGISNTDISKHGKSFPDVWHDFLIFCNGLPLVAFGRDDLVVKQNLRLNALPSAHPPYTNIIRWVRAQGTEVDIRSAHGCDIGPGAGVEFQGHPHNAYDDAASLAAGIAALMEKGATSPLEETFPPLPLCARDTMAPWNAWDVPSEADTIIKALDLTPHPEGGSYREIFRDAPGPDGRAKSTGIYFLLRAGECSDDHRIDAAEVWHFYRGAPLELMIEDESGKMQRHVLGPMVEAGEEPQIVVPPHRWQRARSLGDFTLVGCTVAPGFEFTYFEMREK